MCLPADLIHNTSYQDNILVKIFVGFRFIFPLMNNINQLARVFVKNSFFEVKTRGRPKIVFFFFFFIPIYVYTTSYHKLPIHMLSFGLPGAYHNLGAVSHSKYKPNPLILSY